MSKMFDFPTRKTSLITKRIKELKIIVPAGMLPAEAYQNYLVRKLRKTNANILMYQYQTQNCNIQLGRRYKLERELGIKSLRLYQHVDARDIEVEGMMRLDNFISFVPAGKEIKSSDWRKFKDIKDIINYKYKDKE